MKYVFILLLALSQTNESEAQNFTIQPYLQNASPNSITIMWEFSESDSSYVEWGTSTTLGNISATTSDFSLWPAYIYTAKLNGLQANTQYFYMVTTGDSSSAVFDFYTPANSSDEKSINIVAMSDVQTDGNNPTKFTEIVNDGIIDYVQNNFGGNTNENLDMVLIPGDLVNLGTNYFHWRDEFFAQTVPLFSSVPFYPVLGNHEVNASFYFQYMDLPENGTSGYEEHWWYKDNSNVRIIGLNSNGGYQIQEQLDWLDSILTLTTNDNTIDFVFAELHHPHESELWIAGNTSYTGDVITLLEDFTTSSGKPTIHFYGHTHGYSRGQSKDHTHLMVNVSAGGGPIDYWGVYAQNDYEQYSISQDEWGYVFVEVEAGNDPKFTLKRLSIGDDFVSKTNSLEDSVTIRLNNNKPNTPNGIFPTSFDTVNPDCFILLADSFIDVDSNEHGASEWQISNDCSDFTSPIFDSWKQYENWYFDINTQAGDDLKDELVNISLNPTADYCWRVRYRDKSLAWSDWSSPNSFRTDSSFLTANLLQNIGAEDSVNFWTVNNGTLESLSDGQCNGTAPYAGNKYFGVGGLCVESPFGSASQTIDVSAYQIDIDNGTTEARYGAYMADWNGSDIPSVALQFLDASSSLIFGTDTTSSPQTTWTYVNQQWSIPSGTRFIKYIMMGERNAGTDNDSYVDEAFLKINLAADSCSYYVPNSTNTIQENELLNLKLFPNPVSNSAIVNIPYSKNDYLSIRIINFEGKIIKEYNHVHPPTFTFNTENMQNGLYLLQILDKSKIVGSIKFGVIK